MIFFGLVIYDTSNIKYRKYLYYAYLTMVIGFIVCYILGVIFFFAFYDLVSPYFEDVCHENPDLYPEMWDSLSECENFLKKMVTIFIIACFFIAVPIKLMLTRVLYYGWKEQVHIRDQRMNNFAQVAADQAPQVAPNQYVAPQAHYYAPVGTNNVAWR